MRVNEALRWGASQLPDSDSAKADARVLLCFVLQKGQSYLYTWPDAELDSHQQARFEALIKRRVAGHPVAYLTGYRDFWSLTLQTSPATLIPRPETECLVEAALSRLPQSPARLCDLGTGTGAVALAIASERPDMSVTGVDVIDEAVALAALNAKRNDINNAVFLKSHWFDEVEGLFNMIVSNPPYVEADSDYLGQGDVRFEPATALTSGQDGLNDIRLIIARAPHYLNDGGWLLLEHGYNQAAAVQRLMRDHGFSHIETIQDLAGIDRVTLGMHKTCD